MRAWGEQRVALNRLGTPEDLVGTAVYLAASASDYVSGQCIYVDGGFMAGDDGPCRRWPPANNNPIQLNNKGPVNIDRAFVVWPYASTIYL